ncbi:terpene synthase family protein [Providencia alcalifaciens]|uniref:terpene synthase family protein n=1 Tax=Providencia alcalifaciens TaxID=126385 RepID=UPI003D27BF6B
MPLQLPPLPHPFLPAIHPSFYPNNPTPYIQLDEYDHHPFEKVTRDYADHFELYADDTQRARLANCHCAWFGSLMFPVGSDELLQIGIDFCMWSIAYDDEYCDEGEVAHQPEKLIQYSAEIWRQFEVPEYKLSNDRYALAARDLRIRLDKYATAEQTARFVEYMRVYMMAEMWKAVNPAPSLNDYMTIRLTGGGALAFPTLGHIIANVDIAQRDYENRKVRVLFEALANLMVWEAEPHAYIKESVRGATDKEHNLIRVLMRERQYGFDEAIQEYLEMRDRLLGLILRLKKDIEKEAPAGVCEYIETLIRYYMGATVWSQNTRRYKSISGQGGESVFEGGRLTEQLPESQFNATQPIDFDAVHWWWHYDPLNSFDMFSRDA